MTKTSSLDMMALALAVLLSMKQLSFGRPEIDSYKEVIHLPAQEKNTAIVLFVFSLFKMIYQFYNYLPTDYGIYNSQKKSLDDWKNQISSRGLFMTKKEMT